MSDERHANEERDDIQGAIRRLLTEETLTRRSFMRRSAYAGGALSIPAILAACGIGPAATPSSTATQVAASPSVTPAPTPSPSPSGQLNFANWPLYIDTDEKDKSKHQTLLDFTKKTGIKVKYAESIADNVSFFGTIQPSLAQKKDTGWDLIVMTDWMIGKMIGLGYLEEFDPATAVPQFMANAADKYKDPSYDPGNKHSVPWQSGITGIGYNPKLTKREITGFKDLLDPAFKGKIGMFNDMRDCMHLALLYNGIEPKDATSDDAKKAAKTLLDQAPLARKHYGNEYADDLASGALALTMAWSGDVFQLQFDNPDLKFVVPEEGGILWVDNMAIPKLAKHPIDAIQMMDFVYDPKIAAQITEYVNYICPVPGAKAVIDQHIKDADAKKDKETSDYLKSVAASPLVFPTEDMLSKLRSYKVLSEAEEKEWNDLFQPVITG
jgi:spermidine/putrescine transport system substrate-binding protein